MIDKLLQYSRELAFGDIEARLLQISSVLHDGDAELIVPLVGEFSSGKTTIVNALTDSKALECASRPTTATIYTIHFGSQSCKAFVHNQDGTVVEVADVVELKNDNLGDAVVVDVYDTSDSVPESIVIVDTPGLSSQNMKHQQTLVDFLPNADAVILVADINQQVTQSLADFAKTVALSKRPIYLVFSQCDTKSAEDVEKAKAYLLENTDLPLSGVVSISAKSGDMEAFHTLLKDIQKDKTKIFEQVNKHRCKEIAKEMVSRIDVLLASSKSDSDIDDTIKGLQQKLNRIKQEIESLGDSIAAELKVVQRDVSRLFEDKIFTRLDAIVGRKSDNYDSEAISAINNTASVLLNDYKSSVLEIFGNKTREVLARNSDISIGGLQSLDLSQISMDGISFSYNVSLNDAGHEYDRGIATGLKVAAVAAAIVATAGAAGAATAGAATAGAAAAGGGAAITGTEGALIAADVVDTVTDIGSIIANKRYVDKINKVVKYSGRINDKFDKINRIDATAGRRMGNGRGIVESLVGFVTERTMGKPQRRRVIHEYIDLFLAPAFDEELKRITQEISNGVAACLSQEAEIQTAEIAASLENLRHTRQHQQLEYEAKIAELKNIRKDIEAL